MSLAPIASDRLAPLDLSDNTNLYGVPPAAARVLGAAAADAARYPTAQADALRAAIARHFAVRPEQVTTGCGSDDVLECAIRSVAEPGMRIAHADPTFSMLPVLARRHRLIPVPVPLTATGALDAGRLLAAGAGIVYLCSPNNPTGGALPRPVIEQVLLGTTSLVILDEAYAGFGGESWIEAAAGGRDLLVVRTFSKAFGLAGLRVGYGIGDERLIARLEALRGPYRVGSIAERAAVAALREDLDWVRERAAEVGRDRERLDHALRALGFAPLASRANFVLVPVADATACARRMAAHGIAVRAFPSLTAIGDAVRITVGPWPMMERAIAALAEAAR